MELRRQHASGASTESIFPVASRSTRSARATVSRRSKRSFPSRSSSPSLIAWGTRVCKRSRRQASTSPRRIPQLADADQLLAALKRRPGVRYPVLVPNLRGLDRAQAVGADEIAVFVSATERFAQENLGTTLNGALEMAAPVISRAAADGLRVRGYVSMCFGDPWEGQVDPQQPAQVAARLVEFGCGTISLGDTIGVATAGQIGAVIDAVEAAGVARNRVALHLHDTYGQALANVLAGLEAGVTEFDSSAGGLGGCPYARSATGNLATEDLVWMLEGLGIPTGVDLAALVEPVVG